jgi:phosphoglycolate phosphatase
MRPIRLVVFDVDGTLVDSQANIVRAMTHAFDSHGLPTPDHHAIRRIVGLSVVEAVAALAPDLERDAHKSLGEAYKSGFQHLRRDGLVEEPLFPHARDVIEALDAAGILLGCATGKSDRGLALCLDHHGLRDRFMTLQTADRHPSKPHPAMLRAALREAGVEAGEAVMLGDTSYDMEMAVAAGVTPLGVDWGYHERHELLGAGAAQVLETFPDLLAWMQRA